jgi:hypothetical protein
MGFVITIFRSGNEITYFQFHPINLPIPKKVWIGKVSPCGPSFYSFRDAELNFNSGNAGVNAFRFPNFSLQYSLLVLSASRSIRYSLFKKGFELSLHYALPLHDFVIWRDRSRATICPVVLTFARCLHMTLTRPKTRMP